MKISVIIPVYNVFNYLKQCVASVLELEAEKEIILVDDGSTDGSGALCDEIAGESAEIRVIHRENGGLSAARNTGIENATGDYIMLLDSDDFISAVEADKMLCEFNGSTEILMGLYNKYYEQENRYEKEESPAFSTVLGEKDIDSFLTAMPKSGTSCYMVAWRFIVKREFILENQLFFTEGIYHEDEEWTQRLLVAAQKIFVTDKLFYQYRQARAGSIMATVKPKHILDVFKIMEKTEKSINVLEKGSAKREYLLYRTAALYITNIINLYVLDEPQKSEAVKKLKHFGKICNNHFSGIIGISVKTFQKIFGIRFTSGCLRLLNKIRKGA